MKRWMILISLLMIFGCGELPQAPSEFHNPLDPNDPDYVPPQVEIVRGPAEGETVNTDQVTFSWRGNMSGMLFLYRYDNKVWSAPTTDTTVTLELLDDAPHTFQVKGKYVTGLEGDPAERHFTVDAIKGTSLILYPKLMEITPGQTFSLELRVEEADSFAALSTKLHFNPAGLQVENVTVYSTSQNSIILKNGGQLIEFHDYDNSKGEISLDLGVVEGNPRNVNGSGAVALITFRHIIGDNLWVTIDKNSQLRDDDNQGIPILNLQSSDQVGTLVRYK